MESLKLFRLQDGDDDMVLDLFASIGAQCMLCTCMDTGIGSINARMDLSNRCRVGGIVRVIQCAS